MFTVITPKCEFAVNPLGLGTASPRFSWAVESIHRGSAPSRYQILVAREPQTLSRDSGDLWDSGPSPVTAAPLIEYAGSPLTSRQRAWWKVRVWDENGRPGPYCEPQWFELSLLSRQDWTAEWVGHPGASSGGALYLRKPFTLSQEPLSARLYVTGLGWYEPFINGEKVGHQVLDPAPTETSRRVYFTTHDVTDLLRVGENTLGAVLGQGWSGTHKLIAQLEVLLADGTTTRICTGNTGSDPAWMAYQGPITTANIFDGEVYDSRLEHPGWCRPGTAFEGAPMRELFHAMIADEPGGILQPQPMEPIEVVETRPVASITRLGNGSHLVDSGQNLAGWLRLRTEGPSGTTITLRFGESLHADGTVNQDNLRSAKATDVLILHGRGPQVWEPSFTYHGFRYVQIEGVPEDLTSEQVQVRVVRSAMPARGRFHCGNDLINRIHNAAVWTEASNLHGVPTDCPQRNERMGWLNDLAARSEELIHTFDTSRFLPKWILDIADTQIRSGAISDTAPYRFGNRPADPVSVCYALIPWLLITHHGDLRTAATHFAGIRRWYDYLTSRAVDRIVSYSYYGDWAPPIGESAQIGDGISAISANTPGTLISTAHYYQTALLLSRMAQVLGLPEAADELATDAELIRAAFHREFYRGPGVGYGSGNQACNAAALYYGLTPTAVVPDTVAALVADIKGHDNHLTTGNLCTKYILEVLADHGHAELALALLCQTSYPSWGYMLEGGATTIWERWELETGGGMNSHNHPMYASVDAWFYRRLAGIIVPDDAIGVSHVVIDPVLDARLDHATATLSTVRGEIRSSWHRTDQIVTVTTQIPPGVRAELRLPERCEIVSGVPEPGGITERAASGPSLLPLKTGGVSEIVLQLRGQPA